RFIEYLLKMGGIRATPEQVQEIADRVKKAHEAMKERQSPETFDRIKEELRALRTEVSEREFWSIVFDVI
ncbi:MAG: hypothetical protein DRO73_11000, partial [Candidatus Thorarchaeota archaeon]